MPVNLIDINQPFVNPADGVLTEQARRFAEELNGIVQSSIALVYCVERFDSLALLQDKYPKPDFLAQAPIVMVTGQGLATWRKDLQKWVKASDDTTSII